MMLLIEVFNLQNGGSIIMGALKPNSFIDFPVSMDVYINMEKKEKIIIESIYTMNIKNIQNEVQILSFFCRETLDKEIYNKNNVILYPTRDNEQL